MIIDLCADLHGLMPELQGGDILIIGGDHTACNSTKEWCVFFKWLSQQQYRKKVIIAGNHDNFLADSLTTQAAKDMRLWEDEGFEYLCDNGCEFEGIQIWGTPWSLWFEDINPQCSCFTAHEHKLAEQYALIPDDTDILISHSPAWHIHDQNLDGIHCGSRSLRQTLDRVKPKLFVCGHIHEQGGQTLLYKHEGPNTLCVNASIMNAYYEPDHDPIRVDYEKIK